MWTLGVLFLFVLNAVWLLDFFLAGGLVCCGLLLLDLVYTYFGVFVFTVAVVLVYVCRIGGLGSRCGCQSSSCSSRFAAWYVIIYCLWGSPVGGHAVRSGHALHGGLALRGGHALHGGRAPRQHNPRCPGLHLQP